MVMFNLSLKPTHYDALEKLTYPVLRAGKAAERVSPPHRPHFSQGADGLPGWGVWPDNS